MLWKYMSVLILSLMSVHLGLLNIELIENYADIFACKIKKIVTLKFYIADIYVCVSNILIYRL